MDQTESPRTNAIAARPASREKQHEPQRQAPHVGGDVERIARDDERDRAIALLHDFSQSRGPAARRAAVLALHGEVRPRDLRDEIDLGLLPVPDAPAAVTERVELEPPEMVEKDALGDVSDRPGLLEVLDARARGKVARMPASWTYALSARPGIVANDELSGGS